MKCLNRVTGSLLISSLFLLALPGAAFADNGNGSEGGGDLVDGQLLDFFENEGATEVDPTQLKGYQIVVAPILERVAQMSPDMAEDLKLALKNKKWILDSKELVSVPEGSGIVKTPALQRLAFQDKFQVRINEKLFNGVSDKVQAQLIVHEMVRYLAMKKQSDISEYSIREITRTLFTTSNLSPEKLRKTVAEHGFGKYIISDDLQALHLLYAPFAKTVCSLGESNWTKAFKTRESTDQVHDILKDIIDETYRLESNHASARLPKMGNLFTGTWFLYYPHGVKNNITEQDIRNKISNEALASFCSQIGSPLNQANSEVSAVKAANELLSSLTTKVQAPGAASAAVCTAPTKPVLAERMLASEVETQTAVNAAK